MPIVNISLMSSSSVAPPALQGILSDYQWGMIHQGLGKVEATAHGAACACECCICLFLSFPFIFLCHPCVYASFLGCTRNQEITRLNNLLFGGANVIGVAGLQYTINTDLIPAAMINQITITQQPVMVFSSNTNGYGGGVAMVNVAPQYPQAQAVATYAQPPPEAMVVVSTGSSNSNGGYANVSQVDDKVAPVGDPNVGNRQMMITIPDGVREGQVLTVAAPDGTMVQITVQGNHRPGDQVIIKY